MGRLIGGQFWPGTLWCPGDDGLCEHCGRSFESHGTGEGVAHELGLPLHMRQGACRPPTSDVRSGGTLQAQCQTAPRDRGLQLKSAALSQLDRREFLKAAAFAGTGTVSTTLGHAQVRESGTLTDRRTVQLTTRDAEQGLPPPVEVTQTSCGSDFMVDVLRGLGIEYAAAIPGNTFKGLHESVINYGMLTSPPLDLISCVHEEISVAISHGYAKIAGKPMACMMHSTVGLQHGAMALYNAWADRVPLLAIVGAVLDSAHRRGAVDWAHSVFDGPGLVRDFTKWDDTPMSLSHFAESAHRAVKFSLTPPCGPTVLALDQNLQEDAIPPGAVPTVPQAPQLAPPSGEPGAVRETARMLVAAQRPVLIADRAARTPHGLASMVELAEALQAPVVDIYGRMNFPWRHPLNQTRRQGELVAQADVILGLELTDFWGATEGRMAEGAKRISISSGDLYMKSNYQDFDRFTPVDLAIAADAEATLPALIEEVRRQITSERRSAFERRGASLAQSHRESLERSRAEAAVGWDLQPITTARLCAELYEQIRNEDWALCNGTVFQNYWPQQLWTASQHHQYIGDAGAYGLGYLPGAAIGAALAHRRHGRLAVAIGGDGDLLFSPGALWTAAHHRIPLLYVVHNNRAWHQEVMYVQMMANRRQRGIDRAHIGNTITDPNVDFAKVAAGMGVHGEGPITDPKELGPALQRAVAVVKRGEPALVDVISQGR
jgi:acetolactate synthase I/II/III large subunit